MKTKYVLRAVGAHAKELKFKHGSSDLELVRTLSCALTFVLHLNTCYQVLRSPEDVSMVSGCVSLLLCLLVLHCAVLLSVD
jgi:hypothetical protein